jgi:hypothetical protein
LPPRNNETRKAGKANRDPKRGVGRVCDGGQVAQAPTNRQHCEGIKARGRNLPVKCSHITSRSGSFAPDNEMGLPAL